MSRQKTGLRLNKTDFYPTPSWCFENLELDWTKFNTAHEPCKGDGRLYQWLLNKGIKTTYTEITEDLDYFDWEGTSDLIITNPPFSLAQEFIDYSISKSKVTIMLLRLNFLGSIKRYEWWSNSPPTAIHVLSKRPSFTGSGTDATDYGWFIWDNEDILDKGIFFVKPPTREQTTRDNIACKEAIKNCGDSSVVEQLLAKQ